MDVGFRRMTRDDLGLLRQWLVDPEVHAWFHTEDLTPEGVEAKYAPRIDGSSPEEQWLGLVDGREVFWVQCYPLAAFPEYAEPCTAVGADPAAGVIDYMIGPVADRGRGLGSAMLRAFVDDIGFGRHRWPEVCTSPDVANIRSWRALENAGFHFLGDIETDEGPERLMTRRSS